MGHVFRSIVATAIISAAWCGCSRTSIEGVPDGTVEDGHLDAVDAAVDEDPVGDVHDERDVTTRSAGKFTTVWASSPDDVFVMGTNSSLLSSALRFDGTSWSFIDLDHVDPLSDFVMAWARDSGGSSSSDVFVVGLSPMLPMMPPPPVEYAWHYDGELWSSSISVDPYDALDPLSVVTELRGIWSISPSSAWAAGHGEEEGLGATGIVLHFDGTSWSRSEYGRLPFLTSIWGASDDEMFAVGWEGTIIRRVDGTWEAMESPVDDDIHGIWGRSASDVFAVGGAGMILHFDGDAWMVVDDDETIWPLYSVWGTVDGPVHAVGMRGAIVTLHGDTWELVDSGTHADLHDVWGSSEDDVYAVGSWFEDPMTHSIGVIVHFDGESWKPVEDLPTIPWP